mgnify:CR=1 FL=1
MWKPPHEMRLVLNVLSNAAETRATPTTNTNLKSTDFDVFAFTADGTAFMGKVDTEFGHDGVNIVYKDNKWDYKKCGRSSLLAYRAFGLLRVQSRNG